MFSGARLFSVIFARNRSTGEQLVSYGIDLWRPIMRQRGNGTRVISSDAIKSIIRIGLIRSIVVVEKSIWLLTFADISCYRY